MSRYVTRAWTGDETWGDSVHYANQVSTAKTCVVIDEDHKPARTGLVDVAGRDIYRLPDQTRCGFRT